MKLIMDRLEGRIDDVIPEEEVTLLNYFFSAYIRSSCMNSNAFFVVGKRSEHGKVACTQNPCQCS